MGDDIPPCELNELSIEGSHLDFLIYMEMIYGILSLGQITKLGREFVKPVKLDPHVAH